MEKRIMLGSACFVNGMSYWGLDLLVLVIWVSSLSSDLLKLWNKNWYFVFSELGFWVHKFKISACRGSFRVAFRVSGSLIDFISSLISKIDVFFRGAFG